jgi:UDP-N-acetylmuramate--alanine ligase
MVLDFLSKKAKLYMSGIGGISMSGLAKWLFSRDFEVEGSDIAPNVQTEALKTLGIKVWIGHHPERVKGASALIFTDAVPENDPERIEAVKEGIPVFSRAELLNGIASTYPEVITVAGSHGKTSTTAMCAHILFADRKKFTAHIGGSDLRFDNFFNGGEDIFLSEACEYKKNLLAFSRITTALWLNCDKDHLECYRGFDDLKATFYAYAAGAKRSIVNGEADITHPKNAVTFGLGGNYDYTAVEVENREECYAFTVVEYGKAICRVKLSVAGYFHIYNALAAVAATRAEGVSVESIVSGAASFAGVKRRFERLGEWRSGEVIADYAHHPTEIENTVRLARAKLRGGGRVIVVFQPHTYSRTKLLMGEFVSVLSAIEPLVIFKTYPAREEYDEAGSAYTLHGKIKNSRYAESVEELRSILQKEVVKGDILLFLGAGDIYEIAKELCRADDR